MRGNVTVKTRPIGFLATNTSLCDDDVLCVHSVLSIPSYIPLSQCHIVHNIHREPSKLLGSIYCQKKLKFLVDHLILNIAMFSLVRFWITFVICVASLSVVERREGGGEATQCWLGLTPGLQLTAGISSATQASVSEQTRASQDVGGDTPPPRPGVCLFILDLYQKI